MAYSPPPAPEAAYRTVREPPGAGDANGTDQRPVAGNEMTTQKQADERLLRLADKLDGTGPYAEVGPVPVRKFDLDQWYCVKKGGVRTSYGRFNPYKCATAACACGWAASDSWFRRRGLNSKADPYSLFFGFGDHDSDRGPIGDGDDFGYLFQAYSYAAGRRTHPITVAKRIRKFVADKTGGGK